MTIRPLSGVAVVEVASSLSARLCGRLLVDAGARVTRFLPDGVPDRLLAEAAADWSEFLDLGKEIVPAAGIDQIHVTLESAMLYLTSLACEAVGAAGLSCTSALEVHPDLIAACVTPFGHEGPYTRFRADDAVLSALCGLADSTPGFPDRTERLDDPPVQSLAPLAEFAGGLTAACATFAAVSSQLLHGLGPRHVEVAAVEAATAMMVYEWGVASYGCYASGRRPIDHPLPEPNALLPCSDGSAVVVAYREEHWSEFVELMGSPAWASMPEFVDGLTRGKNWRKLHEHLTSWSRKLSGRELMERAQARGLPCSYALELKDTLVSPHVGSRGSVIEVDGHVVPSDPIVVDGVRRPRSKRPPARTDSKPQPARDAPLAGVTVLDLSHMIAGPVCGQLLAALGADVVLVESSRYPASRSFPPFAGEPTRDASALFNHVNRGKRSVELDLTSEQGRELLLDLVANADVLVENLSAPAAKKLGLDHETLSAATNGLVLVSISGLGRDGPWGDYAAFHSSVIALGGLASVTKDASGRPRLVGSMYPDPLSGTYAALAAQQGLLARLQTGQGCHIEVSMMDVVFNGMAGLLPAAAQGAAFSANPARFVQAADGWIITPPDAAIPHDAQERDRAELMHELQASRIQAGAVLDLTEIMVDAHLNERGFVVSDDHPVTGTRPAPAVPWKYDERRAERRHAPCFGDSTSEVLADLAGLSHEAIARLRSQHVVV